MYLGFGHYGATHGSKWIRSQPDADGWFTLVMAHGHQGTRQFLTAMSTKCTIISGMYIVHLTTISTRLGFLGNSGLLKQFT